MKKILMTLCAFAFVVSTAGIAAAGPPAEKDTKAAKDKPAKEEKAAPAKDEKAAGDKAKK
jgi:predicted small lipoprotein YifL